MLFSTEGHRAGAPAVKGDGLSRHDRQGQADGGKQQQQGKA
jgi:hypothetical protein